MSTQYSGDGSLRSSAANAVLWAGAACLGRGLFASVLDSALTWVRLRGLIFDVALSSASEGLLSIVPAGTLVRQLVVTQRFDGAAHPSWFCWSVLVVVMSSVAPGCVVGEWEGPPDLDTGGSDDGGGTSPPDFVNDGEGRGGLIGVGWGSYAQTIVIGTPRKDQGTASPVVEAGEVGVLVNNGGIELPVSLPSRVIEGANDSACDTDHQFAYDLQANRGFGGAFSFYSAEVGAGSIVDYRTTLVTSAPIGGADSGRVMQFYDHPCLSCVMFPRTPESGATLGDEVGTRFGTALGVGFFEGFDPNQWLDQAFESLVVGAPGYGAGGGVHVYRPVAYRQWRWTMLLDAIDGGIQCDWIPGTSSVQWRERTMVGSQQIGEEFGAAVAVADFNCDGFDDLAVSAPGYDVPGDPDIQDAGILRIYYGGNAGVGQSGSAQFIQGDFGVGGEPEEGDRFASVLAVGNFNGRRVDTPAAWSCWDLAVGTPEEDGGAGEVQIFYGSPSGLAPGQILRLGEADLPGTRDAGDRFGQAIVGAVFNPVPPTGFHDLAVGAPGDEDGGSVVVIPSSSLGAGLLLDQATQLIQGQGIVDANELGDEFGAALAKIRVGMPASVVSTPAIVVGAPGEDGEEGAVFVITLQEDEGFLVPSSSEVWRQADMNATAQAGDRFGSVLAQERAFPSRPWLQAAYSWACEVDGLVVTEASCDTVPTSSTCPSGHSIQTTVAAPYVDIDDGWEGWIVQVEEVDPLYLGPGDLATVEAACVQACVLEYANDPHVVAGCSVSGAFITPSPVAGSHRAARAAIPMEHQNGAGLSGAEVLACSLHDNCCAAFDEAVCPARADRITTAQSQLGRGEEYVVTVSGSVTTLSLDDQNDESASITGTVGFSQCRDGNAENPCPVYLGSAHLELVQSLALQIDCDGNPYEVALDDLEIDLLQPAMGIAFEDDVWAAFPPGALFMQTHVELAGGLFAETHAALNEEPVYLQVESGWLSAQGTGGFEVHFPVACNGEVEPMKAWLTFSAVTATAQPPTLALDLPSTVTCGTVVDLEAITADPDGDHEEPRWIVDGVLLAPDVHAIEVNTGHDIVAVVRDGRGAATTDTHSISCTPP